MLKLGPVKKQPKFVSGRLSITGALVGIFCASAALMPALAADSPQPNTAVPQLMLPATDGWSGFIARDSDPGIYLPDDYLHGRASIERALAFGVPAGDVSAYLTARAFNEYIPPVSGIGPISDGPAHPFYNTQVAPRVVRKNPTWRVADLTRA